jgi:hypothetical protein
VTGADRGYIVVRSAVDETSVRILGDAGGPVLDIVAVSKYRFVTVVADHMGGYRLLLWDARKAEGDCIGVAHIAESLAVFHSFGDDRLVAGINYYGDTGSTIHVWSTQRVRQPPFTHRFEFSVAAMVALADGQILIGTDDGEEGGRLLIVDTTSPRGEVRTVAYLREGVSQMAVERPRSHQNSEDDSSCPQGIAVADMESNSIRESHWVRLTVLHRTGTASAWRLSTDSVP